MNTNYLVFVLSIVVLAGTGFPQGTDPGTENLKHAWTFEDGTANDYVGGANGTLQGGAAAVDGLLWIAEDGQYMEMPGDAIALNGYDEITLDIWYRPLADGNTGYTMLAYFGDTVNDLGGDGYFITTARGNDVSRTAISCGVYENTWEGESGVDGTEYDDGELHHMVSTLTYDYISLFIDGIFVGESSLAENNSPEFISQNYAYLAKGGYAADPCWLGDILEFNIYNKALSEDEVNFLFNRGPVTTAVDENTNAALPPECRLFQSYPNPFNPATNITFDLPNQSPVRISVYDLLGQELARLVDETQPAGRHTVQFDGTNLGSGLYICRMDINGQIFTNRMMLLK